MHPVHRMPSRQGETVGRAEVGQGRWSSRKKVTRRTPGPTRSTLTEADGWTSPWSKLLSAGASIQMVTVYPARPVLDRQLVIPVAGLVAVQSANVSAPNARK